MGIWEGSLGCEFLRGSMCAEGMGCERCGLDGYSGNRDCHRASRSVLKDFTEDALTISAGNFYPKWDSPNGEGKLATARTASLLVELECVAA